MMNKITQQILKDNLPNNSIVQSYNHQIEQCMEEQVVNILKNFHAFNKLTEDIVERLSDATGFDCKELCKGEGIIYDLKKGG